MTTDLESQAITLYHKVMTQRGVEYGKASPTGMQHFGNDLTPQQLKDILDDFDYNHGEKVVEVDGKEVKDPSTLAHLKEAIQKQREINRHREDEVLDRFAELNKEATGVAYRPRRVRQLGNIDTDELHTIMSAHASDQVTSITTLDRMYKELRLKVQENNNKSSSLTPQKLREARIAYLSSGRMAYKTSTISLSDFARVNAGSAISLPLEGHLRDGCASLLPSGFTPAKQLTKSLLLSLRDHYEAEIADIRKDEARGLQRLWKNGLSAAWSSIKTLVDEKKKLSQVVDALLNPTAEELIKLRERMEKPKEKLKQVNSPLHALKILYGDNYESSEYMDRPVLESDIDAAVSRLASEHAVNLQRAAQEETHRLQTTADDVFVSLDSALAYNLTQGSKSHEAGNAMWDRDWASVREEVRDLENDDPIKKEVFQALHRFWTGSLEGKDSLLESTLLNKGLSYLRSEPAWVEEGETRAHLRYQRLLAVGAFNELVRGAITEEIEEPDLDVLLDVSQSLAFDKTKSKVANFLGDLRVLSNDSSSSPRDALQRFITSCGFPSLRVPDRQVSFEELLHAMSGKLGQVDEILSATLYGTALEFDPASLNKLRTYQESPDYAVRSWGEDSLPETIDYVVDFLELASDIGQRLGETTTREVFEALHNQWGTLSDEAISRYGLSSTPTSFTDLDEKFERQEFFVRAWEIRESLRSSDGATWQTYEAVEMWLNLRSELEARYESGGIPPGVQGVIDLGKTECVSAIERVADNAIGHWPKATALGAIAALAATVGFVYQVSQDTVEVPKDYEQLKAQVAELKAGRVADKDLLEIVSEKAREQKEQLEKEVNSRVLRVDFETSQTRLNKAKARINALRRDADDADERYGRVEAFRSSTSKLITRTTVMYTDQIRSGRVDDRIRRRQAGHIHYLRGLEADMQFEEHLASELLRVTLQPALEDYRIGVKKIKQSIKARYKQEARGLRGKDRRDVAKKYRTLRTQELKDHNKLFDTLYGADFIQSRAK